MKWVLVGCPRHHRRHHALRAPDMNLLGALLILVFGFLFFHRLVAADRGDRLVEQSHFRDDGGDLLLTCLIFLLVGWTGGPYYVTPSRSAPSSASPRSNAAATPRT